MPPTDQSALFLQVLRHLWEPFQKGLAPRVDFKKKKLEAGHGSLHLPPQHLEGRNRQISVTMRLYLVYIWSQAIQGYIIRFLSQKIEKYYNIAMILHNVM